MFGLFKKKRTEGEQFLNGATDIHCHILPGVDDGFISLTTSTEILNRQERIGVSRIYFTPHSMGFDGAVVDPKSYGGHSHGTHHHSEHHHHKDKIVTTTPAFSAQKNYEAEIEQLESENKIVPSLTIHEAIEKEYADIDHLPQFAEERPGGYSNEHLKTKFEFFKNYYKGGIDIRLAAEYMMNKEFLDKVKEKDLLTFSDGVHVLIETSYYSAPLEMDEIIYSLQIEGYKPILAHPERYRYMSRTDYEKLKEKGIEFQLTYLSLTGYYGKSTQARAIDLLDRGFYNFTGSDYHRTSTFIHYAHKLKLNGKRTDKLLELFENNKKL